MSCDRRSLVTSGSRFNCLSVCDILQFLYSEYVNYECLVRKASKVHSQCSLSLKQWWDEFGSIYFNQKIVSVKADNEKNMCVYLSIFNCEITMEEKAKFCNYIWAFMDSSSELAMGGMHEWPVTRSGAQPCNPGNYQPYAYIRTHIFSFICMYNIE